MTCNLVVVRHNALYIHSMCNDKDVDLEGWAPLPLLEKITSTAPNIIYIFNQETQANEYSNRSIGESLGYSTEEIREMGDMLFVNLCHPDDLPLIGPHMEALRQIADGEVIHHEYRMRHKQGRWVWLLSHDTIFERNESGAVVRHLGIAADITKQKTAQEQALAERYAADVANEELRSFAYSMSHDMKSPSYTLSQLLMELKEQHGESFDSDAQELLDLSLITVGKMQELVENVLDYTRVIVQDVDFSDVDLNELVKDLAGPLLAEAPHKGAELKVDHLPKVRGSGIQLGILFQNLISNALKFHPSDSSPVVTVSSTNHENDQYTFIHVKDNGVGIAPEYLSRIFEMFKRLHVSKAYPGAGLGLAICKRIALNHGGDITAESVVNQGSTFTVKLKK